MAKATLEYDLDNIDDRTEHMRALRSLDMALAMWDFAYNNKKAMEYKVEEMLNKGEKVSPYDAIDIVYESFWEIMNERGLKIDELIV